MNNRPERPMTCRGAPVRTQRGMSLIVVLLFLVILTMLGLSASLTSLSGERMARNSRDQNIALQAAEAALRDARTDISMTRALSGRTGASDTCDVASFKGFCIPATSGQPVWERYIEDGARSVTLGEMTQQAALTAGNVSKQPRYIIESLPDIADGSLRSGATRYVFRVTAIGYGANPNTKVLVQEVVRF